MTQQCYHPRVLRCLPTIALLFALGCGDNRAGTAAALAIDPAAASVAIGRELVLTARYLAEDGSPAPSDELVWTTSDAAIATVTPQTDGTVLVGGVALGPAVIAASAPGLEAAAMISVRAAELDGLALMPATPTLPVGLCTTVTAIATTSDGATAPVDGTRVEWTSTTGVLAIAADGTICAPGRGADTLHARYQGRGADAPVTVTDPVIVLLELFSSGGELVGTAQQAVAFVQRSDGGFEEVTAIATWSSDAPAIASVSATGLITAHAVGATTIRVGFESFTASTPFEVFPPFDVTPE